MASHPIQTLAPMVGHVFSTSDATKTTAVSYQTLTDTAYAVWAKAIALYDDFSKAAAYERVACARNVAGTLSLVGSVATPVTIEDTAGMDFTIEVSGTTIVVSVTGVAATDITWRIALEILPLGAKGEFAS